MSAFDRVESGGQERTMQISAAQGVVSQLQIGSSRSTSGRVEKGGNDGYLYAAQSAVTISAFGQQINEFYDRLQAIEDPEARQFAATGLTALIGDLGSSQDVGESSELMVALQQLFEEEGDLFDQFFITAGELSDGGYYLGSFASNFVAIEDRQLQQGLIDQTRSILNDESSDQLLKQETFSAFMGGVGRIIHAGYEEAEMKGALGEYFSGFEATEGLRERQVFASNDGSGPG